MRQASKQWCHQPPSLPHRCHLARSGARCLGWPIPETELLAKQASRCQRERKKESPPAACLLPTCCCSLCLSFLLPVASRPVPSRPLALSLSPSVTLPFIAAIFLPVLSQSGCTLPSPLRFLRRPEWSNSFPFFFLHQALPCLFPSFLSSSHGVRAGLQ